MYASAREITRDVSEMVRPARRTRVTEAIKRHMRVVSSDATTKDWSPELTPYMVEPTDLIASRLYEAIVFVGPARSGKTIALVDGAMAYTITSDPADTLIVQTNKDQAEDFSKTRINRTIRFSPDLKAKLSPRAHDDNVLMKFFRTGMALRIGWPSLAVLSGKDVKRVLMTDVDNFTGDLSIDEAFGLALKRIQTFMSSGICVAESSPARDYTDAKWKPSTKHQAPPAPGIASLYNSGDRRRWYWPCMECREYFQAAPGLDLFPLPPLEELLERVKVDDIYQMAQHYSMVTCPHCGVGLDHRWKRDMNGRGHWAGEMQLVHADGTVTGELPAARTASFWLGGVAAAYQSWESILERHLQALKTYSLTGEQKPLRTAVNVDQAMPFLSMSARNQREATDLKTRRDTDLPRDVVPQGVRFLTGTVDVQGNRFVVQVMGWGPSEDGLGVERWFVDGYSLKTSRRSDGAGGFLPLEPAAYLEDWGRITEKVVQRRYLLEDESDRTMPIKYVAIDSQGLEGVAPRALDYWRGLKKAGLAANVRLLKGEANKKAPLLREGFPDARKRTDRHSGAVGDVPMLFLNTDRFKDMVSANLGREKPGPGFYHLPGWLPDSFVRELTAETRTAGGWVQPGGRRNEQFDLAAYNEMLGVKLRVGAIDWNKPPTWAAPWDDNPDVLAADEAPAPRQPPARRAPRVIRSKYVGR
jgi:phage terminase large subunit GpA-like protein